VAVDTDLRGLEREALLVARNGTDERLIDAPPHRRKWGA
jgi:hypothetical protein